MTLEDPKVNRSMPVAHVVSQPYIIEAGPPDQETSITITDDMVKTYSIARTVKFLAIIDIVFSAIYCFSNPWFIIPLIIAYTGYYGAKTFKENYTFIYASYIIIDAIFKPAIFFWYYATLSNDEKSAHLFNVILIILSFMISMWILDIVYKFFRHMQKLSVEQLEYLRYTGVPRRRIMYVLY